jgi:hypothetical protein
MKTVRLCWQQTSIVVNVSRDLLRSREQFCGRIRDASTREDHPDAFSKSHLSRVTYNKRSIALGKCSHEHTIGQYR